MSIQGKANMITVEGDEVIVCEIRERMQSHSYQDELIFLDNVNLHSCWKKVKGVFACIRINFVWKLCIIMKMEYQGVTLCYLTKFNIFSAPNFVTQHLSISQIINWYFSKSVTYSLEDYNSLQVMYINQVNGRKPFGQKYKYNQINSEDNCFDIDPKGPDLFLPGIILHQGIIYNTTITLPFIVHSGNVDKMQPRHTKKYKKPKKYISRC